MPSSNRMEANYSRRIIAMRKSMGMKWTRRESLELIRRLMLASTFEGIDDIDLRVLVRIYNREVMGVRREHKRKMQEV